jgi:hypothetical protein
VGRVLRRSEYPLVLSIPYLYEPEGFDLGGIRRLIVPACLYCNNEIALQ